MAAAAPLRHLLNLNDDNRPGNRCPICQEWEAPSWKTGVQYRQVCCGVLICKECWDDWGGERMNVIHDFKQECGRKAYAQFEKRWSKKLRARARGEKDKKNTQRKKKKTTRAVRLAGVGKADKPQSPSTARKKGRYTPSSERDNLSKLPEDVLFATHVFLSLREQLALEATSRHHANMICSHGDLYRTLIFRPMPASTTSSTPGKVQITDEQLHALLTKVNAVAHTDEICVRECPKVTGHGLMALAGSTVLKTLSHNCSQHVVHEAFKPSGIIGPVRCDGAHCKSDLCNVCDEHGGSKCDMCSKVFCGSCDIVQSCQSCEQDFCLECSESYDCVECERVFCAHCDATHFCDSCCLSFCEECVSFCEECEEWRCTGCGGGESPCRECQIELAVGATEADGEAQEQQEQQQCVVSVGGLAAGAAAAGGGGVAAGGAAEQPPPQQLHVEHGQMEEQVMERVFLAAVRHFLHLRALERFAREWITKRQQQLAAV